MSAARTVSEQQPARKPIPAILALSAVVAAFLIWLIYFRERMATPDWALSLPLANAVFNSMSAICLVFGYINIRRGNRVVHMRFMLSATVSPLCSWSPTSCTTTSTATRSSRRMD